MEQKHKKKKRNRKNRTMIKIVILGLLIFAVVKGKDLRKEVGTKLLLINSADYPKELVELVEKNPETYDFVKNYPKNKDRDFEIDLTKELKNGNIPLFMQWDERWGYEKYGDNMIALTGCGPTCLSMVYIGLKGDASMNPDKMAEFSEKNGFSSAEGTSWSLMTSGAATLGLHSQEIPLSQDRISRELSEGNPIICSMRPGDFTTTGHFIVLTGYENGLIKVNDPNSKKNSEKKWEYGQIESQIKNLWAFEN